MAEGLRAALRILLLSYSQILFAESPLLGMAVLLGSLASPQHGITGLLGAVIANSSAWLFGLDRQALRRGIYGYNGVLVGLALGSLYALDVRVAIVLAVACVGLVFLVAGLNYAFAYYFGLPALSLPFTLVTWGATLSALNMGYLKPLTPPTVGLPQLVVLPDWLAFSFTKLSAVLFQSNAWSGLILFCGLVLYSRVSVLMMFAGFAAAYGVHDYLGLKAGLLQGYSLALSAMFSSLALGGIFVVPSLGSFIFAMIAAVLSVFFLSAADAVLPIALAPMTVPYNLTVLLGLLALRLRGSATLGIQLVLGDSGSPEQNFSRARERQRLARFRLMPIHLPFSGRWIVSQGVDGKHTHQGLWRHAYDFQAVDSIGAVFRDTGLHVEDYFGFGKPVLAPAPGIVHSIENSVEDNPIGVVNVARNWGNYVIIEHLPGWYSCVAHLKRSSVRVRPGDRIERGQALGLCGNSGRSPYPHLHIQFQLGPQAGAPAWPFRFSNTVRVSPEGERFVAYGELEEGSVVYKPAFREDHSSFFPSTIDTVWKVNYAGVTEAWKLSVDLQGDMSLESNEKTKLKFRLSDGVLAVAGLEGSDRTGLYLLGTLLSDLPFVDGPRDLRWSTEQPMVLPFLMQTSRFRLLSSGEGFSVEVERGIELRLGRVRALLRRLPPSKAVFKRDQRIEVYQEGKLVLSSA